MDSNTTYAVFPDRLVEGSALNHGVPVVRDVTRGTPAVGNAAAPEPRVGLTPLCSTNRGVGELAAAADRRRVALCVVYLTQGVEHVATSCIQGLAHGRVWVAQSQQSHKKSMGDAERANCHPPTYSESLGQYPRCGTEDAEGIPKPKHTNNVRVHVERAMPIGG